jgi:para-nitrobenzyl esterase
MTRTLPFAALALAAVACGRQHPFSIEKADPATRRTTVQGAVVGGPGSHDSQAWLGIPFAAPPVGASRWRAPQPPHSWDGTRETLAFGNACPQFASPIGADSRAKPGEVFGSEDCLYLNIWTPSFTPDQIPQGSDRLPVMLWIHGGGNSIGTDAFYDGGHLAAGEKVVIVTAQYRLGPLGWLRQRSLRAGANDAEQSGNFGTLDLIAALGWVRDNIGAFGGDPGNVTIFGESAGGMNVYSLLVSPLSKGLFQRAIVESGGLSLTTPDEAENLVDDPKPGHRNSSNEVLLRLLVNDGKAADRSAAKTRLAEMGDDQLASYLRGKSAKELLLAYESGFGGLEDKTRAIGMLDMPLVFDDGTVLPTGDWTEHLAVASGWNQVPVLVGTNRDEAKLFTFLDPRRVKWRLGVFPHYVDETTYQAASQYMSRTWKATGVDAPAAAMKRSGEANVYAYRFDWHGEPRIAGADLSKMIGAAHGLEIPFVFGHFEMGALGDLLFDKKGRAGRAQLSDAMMSYWTQFARTGSPDRGQDGTLQPWTAWDDSSPDAPKFILFDTTPGAGIHMSDAVESLPRIVGEIDTDPRLPTQADKCRMYHDLAGWTHGLTKADYVHAGKAGCADFPFADYPWGSRK